jgi:hypothetical protein
MSEHHVRLHLSNGKTNLFKYKNGSGKFYVYQWESTGVFSDNYRHIGDARTEDDAIRIMKANADGPVSRISFD